MTEATRQYFNHRTRYELHRRNRFGLSVLVGMTAGMFLVVVAIHVMFGGM